MLVFAGLTSSHVTTPSAAFRFVDPVVNTRIPSTYFDGFAGSPHSVLR